MTAMLLSSAPAILALEFATNVLVFFLLIVLFLQKSSILGFVGRMLSRPGYPPGPPCLPFVGYLPLLDGDYHLKLTRLAEEYGDVYQIFLANKRVVIVSDHRLVREAFRQQVFSGRPDTELTKLIGGFGVINADGPLWREQRAFLHSVLRDFGAKTSSSHSSSRLERSIKKEVGGFLSYLEASGGRPLNARVSLARSVSNIIGSVLMSVTYEEDGGFVRLLQLIDEGFRLLTVGAWVNFMPGLKYVPFFNRAYAKIRANMRETSDYFRAIADRHKATLDPQNVRDFVDAFFVQQAKLQHEGRQSYFSEEQLWQVMGDIFSAGLETVTSTLEWALIFLILNPRVQRRCQREIDAVVDRGREPEYADLAQMPYLEATIMEVQRRGNVIALGNTHATLANTSLKGYFIPKGTHIIPNLWAIHMDPELWDEPEQFRPERFLSPDNKVVKPQHFMPFSVGRRMCVGDTLSKMEIFHFLAGILQRFDLSQDGPGPDLGGVSNISLQPKTFKLCATPRSTPSSLLL